MAKSRLNNIEAFADLVLDSMRDYVSRACTQLEAELEAKFSERVKAVETENESLRNQIAGMPVPKDGVDGKDGAPGERGERGLVGERGEKGEPGEKGDPGVVGKDGVPGEPGPAGDRGEPGEKGEQGIPGEPGLDGKDGAPGERGEKGDPGERGLKGDSGERGLQGEKGEPGVDGKDGAPGQDGQKGDPGERGDRGEKGESGIDGKDGAPGDRGERGDIGPAGKDGLDAIQIEILPAINLEKSYPRGTYARHAGGIMRAYQDTEGMRGWEVAWNGYDGPPVVEWKDDRTMVIRQTMTDGQEAVHERKFPVMLYRSVWVEGKSYEMGDTVTWGGSGWVCVVETTVEKPGIGKDWQLAIKRGAEGKQGLPGKDKK